MADILSSDRFSVMSVFVVDGFQISPGSSVIDNIENNIDPAPDSQVVNSEYYSYLSLP